jgi:hypothetical protein
MQPCFSFRHVALTAMLLFCMVGSAHAFSLGTGVNYGILTFDSAHNVQMSNSTLNGNWGIGTGGTAQFSSGTINGNVDFQGAQQPPGSLGSATITGSVNSFVANVGSAITTLDNLSITLGGESGTSLAITGGGQTINASAGTLNGADRVFNVTALDFTGGITVNGSASDFVVFNFNNGTGNIALKGGVTLTGGISADHVLFNFDGTGGQLGGNTNGGNNGIINADFLFPNMKLNIDNTVINGRLLGGRSGQDFQFVSGMQLTAPPTPVPEPETGSLLLLGLAALGAVGRQHHRA